MGTGTYILQNLFYSLSNMFRDQTRGKFTTKPVWKNHSWPPPLAAGACTPYPQQEKGNPRVAHCWSAPPPHCHDLMGNCLTFSFRATTRGARPLPSTLRNLQPLNRVAARLGQELCLSRYCSRCYLTSLYLFAAVLEIQHKMTFPELRPRPHLWWSMILSSAWRSDILSLLFWPRREDQRIIF